MCDSATNPTMNNVNGLELLDFFDGTNDVNDQFVNLIRGETDHQNQFSDFHHCDDLINRCWVDNQFGPATPGDALFGNFNAVTGSHDLNSVLSDSNFPSFDGEIKRRDQDHDLDPDKEEDQEDHHENDDWHESSEANYTGSTGTAKTKKSKADRSRTLISERRRRGRMKEKLYALRSLVPNITKMDKASIVGDAVRYVQELQVQAKKLKDEIAGLEASLLRPERYQSTTVDNQRKFQHVTDNNQLISKNVIQMDLFQVDEEGFYMRLVCNKGDGVAVSLYKVLELLTSYNIQSSNFSSTADRVELTVTLRVKDTVREMSLPNMKHWLVGALLDEGFEFKSPFSP